MALVGKLLIALGTVLLLHAGYYSVKCASLLLAALHLVPPPPAYGQYKLTCERFPRPPDSPDESYVKLAEVSDAQMPPLAVRAALLRLYLVYTRASSGG